MGWPGIVGAGAYIGVRAHSDMTGQNPIAQGYSDLDHSDKLRISPVAPMGPSLPIVE